MGFYFVLTKILTYRAFDDLAVKLGRHRFVFQINFFVKFVSYLERVLIKTDQMRVWGKNLLLKKESGAGAAWLMASTV